MSQESTKERSTKIKATPRAIALIGPHGGGKTSLLESIAIVTGAIPRKGSVTAGSSLGDGNSQARARVMSTELNVLTTQYLDEEFTFLDCPGSIEFLGDTLPAICCSSTAMRKNKARSTGTKKSSRPWPRWRLLPTSWPSSRCA